MSSQKTEGVMQLDCRAIIKNQTGGHFPNVNTNINAKRMVDLLIDLTTGRGDVARTAKRLLREMEDNRWNVAAGIHSGGIGGGGLAPDPRPHITLQVAGTTYHVRFNQDATKVVEIT